LLISKVARLSNENSIAIIFKFIESDIKSIEISLNGDNWSFVKFDNEESDVIVFDDLESEQFITLHYKFSTDNEIVINSITMKTDNAIEQQPSIENNIPADFQIKPKSGGVSEQINTTFLIEEGV